jgi:hypothetical protein
MFISELVEQYGFNVWVSCGKPGYPAFQVLEKLDPPGGGVFFMVRYADGNEIPVANNLDDYQIVDPPQSANAKKIMKGRG